MDFHKTFETLVQNEQKNNNMFATLYDYLTVPLFVNLIDFKKNHESI